MTRRASPICLLLLILLGCKGPEEYLSDLKTSVDPNKGHLNLGVYDAGLLVHEGLTGLMDEEVLTLSQAGRAVHDAGWLLEVNEVPLIRADAVNLLAHVALRYPWPPLATSYSDEKNVGDVALANIELLHQATKELEAEPLLAALGSPDRAVVERAHTRLKEITGQSLPSDPAVWEEYWTRRKPAVQAEAARAATGPVATLGNLRFASLASSRSVLGYLSISLLGYDVPDLRPTLTDTIARIGRQVVIFGVLHAMNDKDPVVRMAAYRAAQDVLDPGFEARLQERGAAERDQDARVQLLQTLRFYPGRRTIEALLTGLGDRRLAIAITARRSLAGLCEVDYGDDERAWWLWYEKEGRNRWP